MITTIAGTGREGPAGEGGPATAASLVPARGIAALPGGALAIAVGALRDPRTLRVERPAAIRVVDQAGTITTRARVDAASLAVAPDGTLLAESADEETPVIHRVHPDGRVETAADLRADPAGLPFFVPVAGDPFADEGVTLGGFAPAPDGGLVVSRDFDVAYVAPPAPRLLGAALLPGSRVSRPRLRAHVRSTLPARALVEAWRDGRRAAVTVADVPAGESVVSLPDRLRPGLYEARVRLTAAGQVAVASAQVIVGGVLPVALARDFVGSRTDLEERFTDAPDTTVRCRRMLPRRVDCGMIQRRRCSAVAAVRLLDDGTMAVSAYDGGRGRRCRFRRPRL